MERGKLVQQKIMALPALRISAATTELVKGILALYPQASIVPRLTPLEDEDISVEIQLPVALEEIYTARDQLHELVIELQEQYDVLILASAVPYELSPTVRDKRFSLNLSRFVAA
jgi:hypothetical protein